MEGDWVDARKSVGIVDSVFALDAQIIVHVVVTYMCHLYICVVSMCSWYFTVKYFKHVMTIAIASLKFIKV